MVDNGQLYGDGNDGQHLLRKVEQNVLQRPVI
jgi:hypothetical protein